MMVLILAYQFTSSYFQIVSVGDLKPAPVLWHEESGRKPFENARRPFENARRPFDNAR